MVKEVKVSVLIYVLNGIPYIEKCIQSVIAQTLQEIEILIIDGGSTDGTLKIAERLACEDSRVRIIHCKPGVGLQFNTGLREAKGEYIGICESDDYLLPDMYEKQYEIAKQYNLDILRADANHFFEAGQNKMFFLAMLSKQEDLYGHVLDLTKNDCVLRLGINSFWSGLYRRKFLLEKKLFMNETEGAAYQDTSFSFLCSIKAKRAMLSHEAFYCYRLDNPNSSVNNPKRSEMLINEYFLLKKRLIEEGFFEQYKEIYLSWKISGYLGFYGSLSGELREQFIEYMYSDIRDELDTGEFLKYEFAENEKILLNTVMKSKTALSRYLHQLYEEFNVSKIALEMIVPKKEIIVFGTGDMGKLLYQYLMYNGKKIVAFIDNNKELWGRNYKGIPIIEPGQAVCQYTNAIYIVANVKDAYVLKNQLLMKSVREENIIICNDRGFFLKHILLSSLKGYIGL